MPRTEATPARSAGRTDALAVVLRREGQGPELAVGSVSDRDLADARAELWFEAFLRRGHLDVPMEAVQARTRLLHHDSPQGQSVCVGFGLQAQAPGGVVERVFPRTYLEPAAARLARRLVDEGTLQAGERTFYELRAQQPPAAPGAGQSADVQADPAFVARPAAGEPLAVLHAPLAPLRARAEEVNAGDGIPDDYPVFFTREARARAESAARKGAASHPPVETGGLLVGPLCSCPESGSMFAVVVDVLEASHSESTTYSLTYSGKTWARIQTVMRAKQAHAATRSHRILGQVHGHSFLPMEGAAACEDCAARSQCDRTTAFLSSEDRAWCRAVFSCQPWQVSQVFGLDARGQGVETFFGQRGGQLVPRSYHVVDSFEP